MRTVDRLGTLNYNLGVLERIVQSSQALTTDDARKVRLRVSRMMQQLLAVEAVLHVDLAAEANERRKLALDFAIAIESSMTKVPPLEAPFDGRFENDLIMSAARNEYEHAQVVVVPIEQELRNVRAQVSDLRGENAIIAAEHLSLHPVGFVKSQHPHVTDSDLSRSVPWWPDPILAHLGSVDVAESMVQPLWLTVYVPPQTPAGVYVGIIAVEAADAEAKDLEPKGIRLILEVLDFDLPAEQHLRTMWGVSEENWSRLCNGRYDESVAWRYVDLFLKHRMSVSDLTRKAPTARRGSGPLYHLADPDALRVLRERGSAWWNMGDAPVPGDTREQGAGHAHRDGLARRVKSFESELARLEAAGWPHDAIGIRLPPMAKDTASLPLAARTMKEHFPNVPLMSTVGDRGYGLTDEGSDGCVDIWVTSTSAYERDAEKIRQARARGKQVWWQIGSEPNDARGLNWFVQTPPIRARLLMGAAAQKYKPDGFVYHRVDGWRNENDVVGKKKFVQWEPFYGQPDGDGLLIYPGPEGPLSTIRLDNIRDGLEDYEYYWLLDQLVKKAEAKGLGEEKIVRFAKAMLAVPDKVLRSLSDYTEDPQALSEHRYRVAQAILRLREQVE